MLRERVNDSGQTELILNNNTLLLSDTINLNFYFMKKWSTIILL